jgi:hypothetical protein
MHDADGVRMLLRPVVRDLERGKDGRLVATTSPPTKPSFPQPNWIMLTQLCRSHNSLCDAFAHHLRLFGATDLVEGGF